MAKGRDKGRGMSSGVAKGAVGTIAPCRTGQRRKILLDQWFMLLNLIKIKIVLLREAICGLEYAENAFAGRPHWGSSRRSPDLLVGWEGTPLPRPHTTRRLRRSGLPPTHNFWLRHWEGGDGNRGQRRGSSPPPFRIHGSASDP